MPSRGDKIERRLSGLETVQETAWIISSVRSRTALADLTVDAMLRASTAQGAVLVLADADGSSPQAVVASPGHQGLLDTLSPAVLECLLTAESIRKREMTRHTLRPDAADSGIRILVGEGVRGVCNVPLAAQGKCPGAVLLLYDSGRGLGAEAARPLRILARQVAAAFGNLEQFEQLKADLSRAQSHLAAMIESSRILSGATEPGAVAHAILVQFHGMFPSEAGWLTLLGQEGQSIEAVAHLRPDGFFDAELPEDLHAISRWSIETGLPFLVTDPEKHADLCGELSHGLPGPVRGALCVPLAFGDSVLGTIELVNKRDGTLFTNEDIETATAFASQASLVAKNALLLQETRELAIRDPLTGLYNRRHLLEVLEREVARHRRYGTEMSLIIIDVDKFKQINDTQGHAAGDVVLDMLAEIFADSIRDVDIVARMGGDEFAVLLPSTDLDGAIEVARRLQRLALAAEPSGVAKGIKVSVSQGAAQANDENAGDASALLIDADLALYEAKAAGNGLVAVHGRGIIGDADAHEAGSAGGVASAVG